MRVGLCPGSWVTRWPVRWGAADFDSTTVPAPTDRSGKARRGGDGGAAKQAPIPGTSSRARAPQPGSPAPESPGPPRSAQGGAQGLTATACRSTRARRRCTPGRGSRSPTRPLPRTSPPGRASGRHRHGTPRRRRDQRPGELRPPSTPSGSRSCSAGHAPSQPFGDVAYSRSSALTLGRLLASPDEPPRHSATARPAATPPPGAPRGRPSRGAKHRGRARPGESRSRSDERQSVQRSHRTVSTK